MCGQADWYETGLRLVRGDRGRAGQPGAAVRSAFQVHLSTLALLALRCLPTRGRHHLKDLRIVEEIITSLAGSTSGVYFVYFWSFCINSTRPAAHSWSATSKLFRTSARWLPVGKRGRDTSFQARFYAGTATAQRRSLPHSTVRGSCRNSASTSGCRRGGAAAGRRSRGCASRGRCRRADQWYIYGPT